MCVLLGLPFRSLRVPVCPRATSRAPLTPVSVAHVHSRAGAGRTRSISLPIASACPPLPTDRNENSLVNADWLLLRLSSLGRRLRKKIVAAESRRHLRLLKHCGRGSGIWGAVAITGHSQIELGMNVHIGDGAFIRGEGGLIIGDNTHISRNLLLYTVNHRYDGSRLPYDEEEVGKGVVIGRNCWIGMNVCIAPGTTIGEGAIVGMGAVIAGTIPPRAIVGSQKWRVIGERDAARYRELDASGVYGGPSGKPFIAGDLR